jgi:hypothetical protein
MEHKLSYSHLRWNVGRPQECLGVYLFFLRSGPTAWNSALGWYRAGARPDHAGMLERLIIFFAFEGRLRETHKLGWSRARRTMSTAKGYWSV